jgi:cobalt-zinc-cadmium efflux system membrane fusion protein
MIGNVPESDSPLFQEGQPVEVRVMAYPNRVFEGKIIKIFPAVDVNTHRVMIRSQISDPENELRSGMLAEFAVRVQEPTEATAVPANAVVREPDGTMTAWVTNDRHHFSQRVIKAGLRQDDRVQVLGGLQRGELVVTDGAIFLSNMLLGGQAPD